MLRVEGAVPCTRARVDLVFLLRPSGTAYSDITCRARRRAVDEGRGGVARMHVWHIAHAEITVAGIQSACSTYMQEAESGSCAGRVPARAECNCCRANYLRTPRRTAARTARVNRWWTKERSQRRPREQKPHGFERVRGMDLTKRLFHSPYFAIR